MSTMRTPENPNAAVKPVEPLRFPLRGSRLIEASAGTGKTYTIAALYLRLVLGHGGPAAAFGYAGSPDVPDLAVQVLPGAADESRAQALPGEAYESCLQEPSGQVSALRAQEPLGEADDGAPRPLMPPEILVVTFTNAAAQELRDRIRARLADAAVFFQESALAASRLGLMPGGDEAFPEEAANEQAFPDENGLPAGNALLTENALLAAHGLLAGRGLPVEGGLPVADDGLLQELRNDMPVSRWPACARRLQLAAECMDEAAVFTIHGWCQRMLREHAFDSRGLFDLTLSDDTSGLLAEACRDYWRVFCQGLDHEAATVLHGWWDSPESLQAAVSDLLEKKDALPGEGLPPAQALGQARQQRREALERLKAPWREGWIDELARFFGRAYDPACKWLNGRVYRNSWSGPWLDALRAWVREPDLVAVPFADIKRFEGYGDGALPMREILQLNRKLSDFTPDKLPGLKKLTAAALREGLARGVTPEKHPQLAAMIGLSPDRPAHPALQAMEALPAELAALPPDGYESVLLHAVHWIEARYRAARDQKSEMNFDDLLTQLLRALDEPGGEQLAARMARQYPVAMIDEFQDTDTTQYRIFDHVYRVRENLPQQALIMIGDPKQAIYAFRGGDIHTYLKARQATAGRHYTLDTNFRSSAAMVGAVNHLFCAAEQRTALGGAFRFVGTDVPENPLPFLPVKARGRSERWHDPAHPAGAPALTFWMMSQDEAGARATDVATGQVMRQDASGARGKDGTKGADGAKGAAGATGTDKGGAGRTAGGRQEKEKREKGLSKTAYRAHYAQVTAAEIARLLAAGARGEAYFWTPAARQETGAPEEGLEGAAGGAGVARPAGAGHAAGHCMSGHGDAGRDDAGQGDSAHRRPVKPADMAVLVNDGQEARAIRRALRAHGIRSVYLSDSESVFATPVVGELLFWLQACAEPGSARAVRAALGTSLCGLDAQSLLRLSQDELYWEVQVARFMQYRDIWRRQGVLPMIRRMLQDFRVVEQLLARDEERQLTDLLHLSELLQTASGQLEGEHALIRYLREQRRQPEGERDARKQRLESDDARVRVVTVHKSKGLEYPLVFLPYACAAREVDPKASGGKTAFLSWHDAQGDLQLTLCGSGELPPGVREQADEERLGEDLRKLYVALTRARHATWVGIAPLDRLAHSAAGHLLGLAAAPVTRVPGGGRDDGAGGAPAGVAGEREGRADAPDGKTADAVDEAAADAKPAPAGSLAGRVESQVAALVASARPGEMAMVQRAAGEHEAQQEAPLAERPAHWKTPPALAARRWPRWWIASYSALDREDGVMMAGPAPASLQGGYDALRGGAALSGGHDALREVSVLPGSRDALRGDAAQPARRDGHRNDSALLGDSDAPYGDSVLTERWAEQQGVDAAWQRQMQARALQDMPVDGMDSGLRQHASIAERMAGSFPGGELVSDVLRPAAGRQADGELAGVHAFARGPQAGTFLHGLLEWAGQQGFAAVAADRALLAAQVRRRLQRMPAWQPWEDMLTGWLLQVLTQPLYSAMLPVSLPALADLPQYQVEMGFMLAVNGIDLPGLDAWVRANTQDGAPRPALLPGQLNGMLKGFIDLVFVYEGRYFVLDYKSNWLGSTNAAYRPETMAAAVLAHRYELQYLFYVLALHRLLKVRLPDYDYDRHVGGALYLFLRGMSAPSGGVFAARPSREMIETLDAAFAGRKREVAA
jgi:ATP-dependent exoDNAse (exonuclease V) beta subunit (contains helicase and exonuclease domains)